MIPRITIRNREDWDTIYGLLQNRIAELNGAIHEYCQKNGSGSDYERLLISTQQELHETVELQRELQKIKNYARKVSH